MEVLWRAMVVMLWLWASFDVRIPSWSSSWGVCFPGHRCPGLPSTTYPTAPGAKLAPLLRLMSISDVPKQFQTFSMAPRKGLGAPREMLTFSITCFGPIFDLFSVPHTTVCVGVWEVENRVKQGQKIAKRIAKRSRIKECLCRAFEPFLVHFEGLLGPSGGSEGVKEIAHGFLALV